MPHPQRYFLRLQSNLRVLCILTLISGLILSACQPADPTVSAPAVTLSPTRTSLPPSQTAAPTATSTARPTAAETARIPTPTPIPYCDQLAKSYRPADGLTTYCDADFGFAFDYPQAWRITFVAGSADKPSSSILWVRKAQRFEAVDMSNYIRVDTFRLSSSMTLSERVQNFISYADREYPNKDYPTLKMGGQRAYAILNHWQQDYSAVYLFFEYGEHYTVIELKAISRSGLETNWKIAQSVQAPGAAPAGNEIPADLIQDSETLLP